MTAAGAILLIERDPVERRRSAAALSQHGKVIATETALDGISRLAGAVPAAVVATVELSEMSELVALARLRELPNGRDVALFVVSSVVGAARTRLEMHLTQLRIRGLLHRPLDADAIATIVGAMGVGGGRPAREPRRSAPATARASASPTGAATAPASAGTGTSADPPASAGTTAEALSETLVRLAAMDYFQRLGASPGATTGEIRQGFLRRIRHFEPSTVANPTPETRRLLRSVHESLTEAYAALRDPAARRVYMEQLAHAHHEAQRSAPGEPAAAAATERPRTAQGARRPPVPGATDQAGVPPARVAPDVRAAARRSEAPTQPDLSPVEPAAGGPPRVHGSASGGRSEHPAAASGPETGTSSLVREALASLAMRSPPGAPPDEAVPPSPAPPADEPARDDIWGVEGPGVREPHVKLKAAAHLQAVVGDFAGAVELLEECLRLRPDDGDVRYQLELNRGRKLRDLGNKGRARQHFEAAIALAPPGNDAAMEELSAMLGAPVDSPRKGGALGRLFRRGRKA